MYVSIVLISSYPSALFHLGIVIPGDLWIRFISAVYPSSRQQHFKWVKCPPQAVTDEWFSLIKCCGDLWCSSNETSNMYSFNQIIRKYFILNRKISWYNYFPDYPHQLTITFVSTIEFSYKLFTYMKNLCIWQINCCCTAKFTSHR